MRSTLSPPMLSRHRPLFALLCAALLVSAVLYAVVGLVIPTGAPPSLEPSAPPVPALTHRLLLVIVDGLRWDVATDPARMPNFSRAVREETGGQLMAGRVSMTTSAIMTIGTGQRGSLEQIVRNINPTPPPFDSWLRSAKQAGLSVMSVGDPAWVEMYGKYLVTYRKDPEGVAIDVDFNPTTFRDARELLAKRPDALIVHFVTPDHQGHAHSIPSTRYANHIRGFDRDLFAFFDELEPDWTVVVAGDHGAADSGTHGADTLIQRRTVVFARGPGIVRGVKHSGPIDQADLAGTLAVLLGLPTPVHSRGHVLTEWLDLSPTERAELACSDARRATNLARSLGMTDVAAEVGTLAGSCEKSADALAVARHAVSIVDTAIERQTGLGSPLTPPLVLLLAVLGIVGGVIAAGRPPRATVIACVAIGVLGVGMTWGVERLPGGAPNKARVLFYILGNLPALAALAAPGRFGRFLETHSKVAPALLPGFLVATYTTGAQAESYVAVAVGGLLLVLVGGFDSARPTLRSASRVLGSPHLALLLGLTVLLYSAGTRETDVYPIWLRRDPWLVLSAACAAIGLGVAVLTARSRHRRRYEIAIGAGILIIGALVARRFVPPWPGRAVLAVALVTAAIAALRGQRLLALLSGMFAYAWISRDAEIIAVVATLLVADGVGAALARHRAQTHSGGEPLGLSQTLLVTTFLFGLAFVQRIGIQGALDIGAMDWGVAGFGDPHVPAWLVGGALGTKYALGLWLVLGAFLSEVGAPNAQRVAPALFIAFLARATVLAVMFLTCGSSFWTGLRVLGDLPFAMLWSIAAGLAWLALRYSASLSSSS
jgi:hypothetical protein